MSAPASVLQGIPTAIVGVLAAGFTGIASGDAPDVFVPMCRADTVAPSRVFKYDSPRFSIYIVVACRSLLEFDSLSRQVDRSLSRDRMLASMAIGFAGLASTLYELRTLTRIDVSSGASRSPPGKA